MNRRSFVASLAALFAWMLPKPPRKRFVQRTFPNPVNPEYAKADEWLQEDMKRRMTREEITIPPGHWRITTWENGIPMRQDVPIEKIFTS